MYASVIEFQFKPGMTEAAIEHVLGLRSRLGQIDGLNQIITIDRGDDRATGVVIYDSEAQREAAAPQAQEVLAGMAEFLAAPPDRQGFEISLNEKF